MPNKAKPLSSNNKVYAAIAAAIWTTLIPLMQLRVTQYTDSDRSREPPRWPAIQYTPGVEDHLHIPKTDVLSEKPHVKSAIKRSFQSSMQEQGSKKCCR